MRLVPRLVGLWILLGAYGKLFHGSPADLPALVRDLPLSLSLTFKLIIAVELVVGMLAVLRPSVGWLPAMLVLLAFIGVLGVQVAEGADNCGCFGTAVQMEPQKMLALDVAMLLLLIVSSPWRAEKNRLEVRGAIVAVLALLLIGMPWIFDREGKSAEEGGYLWFEKTKVLGRPLSATSFGAALPKEARIENGLVIIYKNSCEMCADHLEQLEFTERGERPVVMLRLPEDPDEVPAPENKIRLKPRGPGIVDLDLPPHMWGVTPPLHLEIQDGKVRVAKEGSEVTQH